MSALLTLLGILTSGAVIAGAYLLGWYTGRKYGQDEQYVEDWLEQGRKDAARRDARGQFRALSGRN